MPDTREIPKCLPLREALRLADELGVAVRMDDGEYRIRWGALSCVQNARKKDANRPFLKVLRRAAGGKP